nr:DUF1289 domain-containing protein [Limibaculum sp. NKW23]
MDSPCVKVCVLHPETRLCIGCARSGEEIARWSSMGAEARARITAELPGREPAPGGRRGGAARRRGERTRPA